MAKTSAETTGHEVDDPGVGQPASYVEVLDGELSNEEKAEQAAELSACGVVGPVEVGTVDWAGHDALHVVAGEPASQLTKMTHTSSLRLRGLSQPVGSSSFATHRSLVRINRNKSVHRSGHTQGSDS